MGSISSAPGGGQMARTATFACEQCDSEIDGFIVTMPRSAGSAAVGLAWFAQYQSRRTEIQS